MVVYSLNVPVPGRVSRVASELYPSLVGFETVREDLTLVAKRLGDAPSYPRLESRVRTALAGTPPFEAGIEGIETFDDPPRGSAPVVYLAVESPKLSAIHDRLADEFPPVEGIEGEDYVPHVTLARGGDPDAARSLSAREIEPVAWTVTELLVWDATYGEVAGRISLPA